MKIVFNETDVGINLSEQALSILKEMGVSTYDASNLHRHECELVHVVEELGNKASATGSCLKVMEADVTSYIIVKNARGEAIFSPEEYNFKYNN
jgi:hypothetical protein